MRIIYNRQPAKKPVSLQSFANLHDFTMVANERDFPDLPRWYASFQNVEVKEGNNVA